MSKYALGYMHKARVTCKPAQAELIKIGVYWFCETCVTHEKGSWNIFGVDTALLINSLPQIKCVKHINI